MNRVSAAFQWPALVMAVALVAGTVMLEAGKCLIRCGYRLQTTSSRARR